MLVPLPWPWNNSRRWLTARFNVSRPVFVRSPRWRCRGGAVFPDVKATTRPSRWGSCSTGYRPGTRRAAGPGSERSRTPDCTKTSRCPSTAGCECAASTSDPKTTRRTSRRRYSTSRPNRCWRAARCRQCSPGDRTESRAAPGHLRPLRREAEHR